TFNNKQNASTELTGVSGLSTTGYVQRTGAGTYSTTSGSTAASNNTLVQRDGSGVSNFYGVGVTGATSGTVTQRAPATVTSYSVTWPSAVAGTANSVLASDTSGNLSWINLGSVAGTINLTSQVTGVLPIANGGTNSSTALTNNQLMFSNAGAIKELGAMTDGQIVIGKSAASPQIVSMSGDVTILNTGATTVGKINGTTVTGVGLADSNLLQNTSGGAIAGNSVLVSNGTGTGVTSLSTPVSSVLTSTGGSVPTWSSIASDTFTQYALLAGRSGGQTLYGGSAASNNLTLDSTSHATKGNILLNPSGGNVGIGTTSPVSGLNTVASSNSTNLTPILDFGTGAIFSRYVVNNFSQTTPVTVSSANTTDSNLFYTDLNPSANLSLPYNGIEATLTNPNGASFGSTSTVNGINSVARLGGNTATYSTINAIQANMQSYLGTNRTSEVALNAMTSILNNAQNAATLTNQIPVNISASNSVSNSTVTNQYGINISMANSGTVTNRYGIYIAGTNMGVQTNTPFDIYASDAGAYNYFAGNVGIGTTSPGYNLDVNGSVNATAFYLNGTSFSPSATSTAVAAAGGQVDAITQSATDAASASRSVLTLRNNGAGGNNEYNMVGLNASGAVTSYINQAGAASFVNSVITPTLYGNSTASANLTLDSTSNATKGNIILAPTGGNVGIGTTTPSSVLSTSAGNNTTVTTSYYSWPTNSTQYVTNQYNNSTITAASSATSANLEQITLNPSSSLNQTIYGHQTYIQAPPSATFNNSGSFIATAGLARDYSSVGTGGYQYGGNFQSVFAGVATRNALYGITSAALIQNYNSTNQASVVGNLYGGNFAANNNSTGSSVTSGAYAINAGSGNSGTIASQYGLNISLGNSSTGTITNRYGVYVNGSNSGTLTNTAYDIYANTSNAYNYFAGNVGIGITNPDQKLTVMGNIRAIFDGYWTTKDVAGITYLGASGGTGAANWALRGVYQYPAGVGTGSDGGDLDLIKSLDGNTVLGTKTDGTPLGNVGIGTTTPTARFEVNGTRAYAAPADSWGTVQKQFKSFRLFGDSGVSTAQFVLIGRYSPGTSWALGSAPIIRVAKTYFDSQAAWTEYVVDRSGNLKLVRNSGDLTNWLKITPATSYGGRSDVYELWLSVPSYNEAVVEFEHISGFSTIAGTAAAYAVLEPAATNSPTATDPGNLVASSVAGTVFSGGNVGIGTANPSSKLEISTVSSSGSQSTTLTIGSGLSGSASGNAVINFVGTNNGTASTGQIFSNYLGGMIVQPSNSDPSVTINGTSGNVANTLGVVGRAVIGDQTWVNTAGPTNGLLVKGNVGIGTTSPTYQLQLSTDSAAKPGTSTWTIASDERLKDIRAPFDRGLASIEGIHPIYFNYKKDNALDLPSEKEYVGIKAQDALKAVPEAVSQDDKGYYHVTNDAIIWTVLNAVKELYHKWLDDSSLKDRQIASIKAETEQANAKASKLEAENAEKDKEIKDLKARLERIEKMLQSK
ncbi:MAG: tail fiber domain-containing protein, partial [Pseudobdellovibrionaceae bacterium]